MSQQGNLKRVFAGPLAVAQAKQFVDQLMAQSGVHFVVDKDSDPTVLDVVGVVGYSSLSGAVPGAVAGGLLGLLFGRSEAGFAIGAVVGGAIGAATGVQKLDAGWRIRAVRDALGQPHFTFTKGAT